MRGIRLKCTASGVPLGKAGAASNIALRASAPELACFGLTDADTASPSADDEAGSIVA